jgi:hypothetical protein
MKNSYCLLLVVLAGCGGGGGGGGGTVGLTHTEPVVSTLSFPVGTSMNASAARGARDLLRATGTAATAATDGDCTGTYDNTDGPAGGGATFEGVPAFSVTSVTTFSFTNCTPASSTITGTTYYDSNYVPLGDDVPGSEYGVFAQPAVIPTTAKVGDAGIIGTMVLYSDSTKTTATGQRKISFAIEPDTANTAIVNLISKDYDISNVLEFIQQERYRINATGDITLISIDELEVDVIHLIFRL